MNWMKQGGLIFSFACYSALAAAQSIPTEQLVPQSIIDGHKKGYSQDECALINLDLENIRKTCFWQKAPSAEQQPIYVATAGGPGACKSTILETYLHDKLNFVYIDPDRQALRYMINTYYQSLTNYEISKHSPYTELLKNAYDKWRGGSNYIATVILNEAYAGNYNIAHGTTSTPEAVRFLYQKLKKQNYKIVLLLCYAKDETRVKAVEQHIPKGFIQTAPEDVISKGKAFPERFPIYFEYADELNFYWTEDVLKGSVLAASCNKKNGLTIHNQDSFNTFVQKYEEDRKQTSALPTFNELIAKFNKIERQTKANNNHE